MTFTDYSGQWVITLDGEVVDHFDNLLALSRKVDRYVFTDKDYDLQYVLEPGEVQNWAVRKNSEDPVSANLHFSSRQKAEEWIKTWTYTIPAGERWSVWCRANENEDWVPCE